MATVTFALLPSVCAAYDPGAPAAACLAGSVLKLAARGVALPMFAVYLLELRARRVFAVTSHQEGGGGDEGDDGGDDVAGQEEEGGEQQEQGGPRWWGRRRGATRSAA